jgi:hypothetical protein
MLVYIGTLFVFFVKYFANTSVSTAVRFTGETQGCRWSLQKNAEGTDAKS